MKRLFLGFFFLLTTIALNADNNEMTSIVVEKQFAEIEELSNAISESGENELATLDLYNKRGICYFFIGKLDLALNDFNHILDALYSRENLDNRLFGAALWERMLCHAYANDIREAYEDLALVRYFFIENSKCNCCEKHTVCLADQNNNFHVLPVAQFADPNEKISPRECEDRVKGTAKLMRLLTIKFKDVGLAGVVNVAINELEEAALRCCNRTPNWTACLSPIVDAWHNMKEYMDKGVALAPYLLMGRY